MFTPISPTGRVTADFSLQTSQNGNDTTYVQFYLAVNKGYGENQHPNYFQCILFGKAADRIINAGVKKGSLISVMGDLDLVEYTRTADGTKGTIPKITVYDWCYVPAGKSKTETEKEEKTNQEDSGFETLSCGENGLPFE